MNESLPKIGVGAVIWRGPDALLLIRRGKEPLLGQWSLPGGTLEPGETLRAALAREVAEETGLEIEIGDLIDVVDAIGRNADGTLAWHYVIADFSARWLAGEAAAASDVLECRWVSPEEAIRLVSWDETRRIIRMSAKRMWGFDNPLAVVARKSGP
ncbi:MAG TPA: NUDIX hydrolase [Rhizomicrobium sp.]|nr:NUDIX hydrolase [Rhizomicrobium sp.]